MSCILLVDDSPADRALFRTVLARAGFTVHELATGQGFLERVHELRPLAVILDVNLPDTDGHTLCRQLKADPAAGSTPVLMLTVRDDEADILAGLAAGADDYVAKDSAHEIILARLKRLIHDHQLALVATINQQHVQAGRLLTGIVHEIRAPLAVIRGYAEMLRMALADHPEAIHNIEPILRNAQILQARLDHLMAAVRQPRHGIGRVELEPLVREAADLFVKGTDPQHGRLDVKLQIAEPLPRVRGNAGSLIQVLMNLLGNADEAIREHAGRGRVVIRAMPQAEAAVPGVAVEVADSGPGIPEAFLGRIFEPFFTTKKEGSGYGLYLASEILREQGGRLTARNEPGGGACFTLWLPLAEP